MIASRWFSPWELIPDLDEMTTWDEVPDGTLDPRLLTLWDSLRDLLGPLSINNYHRGGYRRFCGLRDERCSEYSPTSQHALGKAGDGHSRTYSADEARSIIRQAVARGELPELGGLEIGVPWIHADVRDRRDGKVIEFGAPPEAKG